MTPDALRGLGSSWHELADSLEALSPGDAMTSGTGSIGRSATAKVMAGARSELDAGVRRTARRFHAMADAARQTADNTEEADAKFAAMLRRIDGVR